MKLNIGCGKKLEENWINLDRASLLGVDIIFDLEECRTKSLPIADSEVEEVYASHVIEHIKDLLPVMQELHRVSKFDAKFIVRVPYGSSDNSLEDPTHVRQFFLNSWMYFGQPVYGSADYGYTGDWLIEQVDLVIAPGGLVNEKHSLNEVLYFIKHYRNVVDEMIATLRCIKPARMPGVAKGDENFTLNIKMKE